MLGPNTAGFANLQSVVFANFMAWLKEIPAGTVGLASQSGANIFNLAAYVQKDNLGLSVAIAEAVDYLENHDGTDVIVLYLEGVKHGRALYDTIRRTTAQKPVVVLTVGKGDIGDFAASHTGNLIGSYQLKRSALRQAGAAVVDSGEALIDAARALSQIRLEPAPNPGVGVVTGQAGPAMLLTDLLMSRNVSTSEFGLSTVEKLKALLPSISYMKNPIDTTRPGESFPDVITTMADDPAIQLAVTFLIYEPAAINPVRVLENGIPALDALIL